MPAVGRLWPSEDDGASSKDDGGGGGDNDGDCVDDNEGGDDGSYGDNGRRHHDCVSAPFFLQVHASKKLILGQFRNQANFKPKLILN